MSQQTAELFEVVGGADRGGILVREGPELTSKLCGGRLACGALVQILESREERAHYQRVDGAGPDFGWVTRRKSDGRDLLVRASGARRPGRSGGEADAKLAGFAEGDEEPVKPPAEPAEAPAEARRPAAAAAAAEEAPAKAEIGGSEEEGPTVYRVVVSGGTAVLSAGAASGEAPSGRGSDYKEVGRLHKDDVVAVKERFGNWFKLAGWETLNGWVPPRDDESRALEPAPGVPVSLLRLRAVVARTERHLIKSQNAGRPWAPLPKDPAFFGEAPLHSVHSPIWGIEASCSAVAAPLRPPGREWRVFTTRAFAEGQEIERCEVLTAAAGLGGHCQSSVALRTRLLGMSGSREEVLPLGFGALYRHVTVPELATASVVPVKVQRRETPQLVVRARRPLKIGEEVTVCLSTDSLGRRFLPGPEGPRKEYSAQAPPNSLPPGGRSGIGSVYVGPSSVHGLGVFAARSFEGGEIVELCPLLLLDKQALAANAFSDFRMSFDVGLPPCSTSLARAMALQHFGKDIDPSGLWWPPPGDNRPPRISGLALGAGPLYNHASRPEDHNLWWSLHPGLGTVVMQAKKFIRKDAEIFIDYGGTYWSGRNVRPK